MKSDENNINTIVLYLSEMIMIWWNINEADIGKGTCTINTWERLNEEFKKVFFPKTLSIGQAQV